MHVATVANEDALTALAEKLGQLDPRARISLLLRLGVPAVSVMGVERCAEHAGWKTLPDHKSLAFDGTVVWCVGCHRWWEK